MSVVRLREEHEVADKLDRLEMLVRDMAARWGVVAIEPWLTKRQLAEHLACSPRYLDERVSEGMPHRKLAGGNKFRVTAVETWLRQRGFLEDA